MTFSQALELIKTGYRVARSGWNGKNMWVEAKPPNADSDMGCTYAFITNAQGKRVPWMASQDDLFADDWEDVDVTEN